MKERPILMTGETVRAILDGRKTQTRRLVKLSGDPGDWIGCAAPCNTDGKWVFTREHGPAEQIRLACPYGVPGDGLWVKETWKVASEWNYTKPSRIPKCEAMTGVRYQADVDTDLSGIWRPSIFMPREFSRIDLEVTAVRVERLQEISDEDAKAEGVTPKHPIDRRGSLTWNQQAYRALWESINGSGSWDLNPWVWVITFKKL